MFELLSNVYNKCNKSRTQKNSVQQNPPPTSNSFLSHVGLLVGAYNTTHQQHFLVKPCASAQNLLLRWLGVYAGGGWCSINTLISVNCKQQSVQKINHTKIMSTTTPTTNVYVTMLSHARQRKNLGLQWVGVCTGGGGGVLTT